MEKHSMYHNNHNELVEVVNILRENYVFNTFTTFTINGQIDRLVTHVFKKLFDHYNIFFCCIKLHIRVQ